MTILPLRRKPPQRPGPPLGEKCVLLLIFTAFAGVCFGALFFAPDFSERPKGTVKDDQFLQRGVQLQLAPPDHEHKEVRVERGRIMSERRSEPYVPATEGEKMTIGSLPAPTEGKEPADPIVAQRRKKIREMAIHAWKGYEQFAWGENELKPLSKRGHSASVFGHTSMGATIVDSLDTLYIMGLNEEFDKARDWVINTLNFEQSSDVSVFEMTIRFVGGLLSTYALTGDKTFALKATSIARRLLPAFDTPSHLSYSLIDLKTKQGRNWRWAPSRCSILAEVGTMHLEFAYLSEITKDPVFFEKVEQARDQLVNADRPDGLYYNYMNPDSGQWCQRHVSLGALGDSFYEYLLKAWIQTDGKDKRSRRMYDEAMTAVDKHLIAKSTPSDLFYLTEKKNSLVMRKMDHLACFAGGMFALGTAGAPDNVKERHMTLARKLTHTCHESYSRTATHLGPESFYFSGAEARGTNAKQRYYIQRPEVIESYFYLWRLTKDPKYREWGWEAAQAIEKHCRVEHGYSGIRDVDQVPVVHDDVQQSFFLAETLKYLYLLFSDDDVIPLDKWVFNTEAHPLPILHAAETITHRSAR